MSDYVVLRRIRLSEHHRTTGRTRHTQGVLIQGDLVRGEELPRPHELLIAQLPPDKGYYLLHLDDSGQEITDTYHDSLEDALAQAKWEFELEPSEWKFP